MGTPLLSSEPMPAFCPAAPPYQRREPERSVLDQTIHAHLATFLAQTAGDAEWMTLEGKKSLTLLLTANKRLNTAYLLKESFGQ